MLLCCSNCTDCATCLTGVLLSHIKCNGRYVRVIYQRKDEFLMRYILSSAGLHFDQARFLPLSILVLDNEFDLLCAMAWNCAVRQC